MLVRVWKDFNIDEIKKCLLVWGQLSGDCANCKAIGIALESKSCPSCKAEFKYIALRAEANPNYVERIRRKRPDLTFIEWKDFSYQLSKSKARDLL